MTRSWSTGLFVAVTMLAMPRVADAQSAIAGIVRDTTGAVLPGVTVEATSPVLIEKSRTVITDAAGQYKVIDLRPGIYTVTFTLSGFGSTRREGIVLETNFTAPVNIELKVGDLTETITVSGQSPTVDVQTTQRREVLTREVLDAVPTGRNYQSIGGTLPAVSMGRSDVAGSTAMQQGTVTVYGSLGGDMNIEVDGMSVSSSLGSGSTPAVYHNDGAYQEYVYQVSGGTAESGTGGVRINMIPREGGNRFTGDFVTLFANTSMQGHNLTDELRARGLTTPAALYRLYDFNGSVGGPILRDRLWFFTSARTWAYNAYVANAFNPDGSQAIDDNKIEALTNRLTTQLSRKNKLTVMYDRLPKWRGHRELELGGVDPKATYIQVTPLSYDAQVKWTSTVSSKVLLEAGYSTNYYSNVRLYQADVKRPSATDPYGDISKVDILRGTRWNAAPESFNQPFVARNLVSAVSYVTGSHAIKTGVQYRWSWIRTSREQNGSLTQRYRNGVPDSVEVRNIPVEASSNVNADVGLYVQDSWTMKRMTLNPGLRVELFNGSVPEQSAPAGRFVAARHFDAIENLPNWKDVSPRFGASFDLFGNGRTAIKGSIGKYMQQEAVGFPERYNPMVVSTDQRTWNDLNRDDIAQDNELGPTTNLLFGVRRNRNPDPDIKRPYQLLYNVGAQQEILPGVAVSVNYFRRGFYQLTWTDNLATTFADYTLIQIPDPRGNGQMLDIYNISREKNGLVDELDTNSTNNSTTFNGVDLSLDARRGGATIKGGLAVGRTRSITCQVDNPNSLRFCDQTKTGMPFQKQFKLSGVYPLPYGIKLSGVFQSMPGLETSINYLVNRSIIPTLTVASITVALNEPQSLYNDRNNQLDFSVAKEFRVRGLRIRPQLDLFNALNVSPVVAQVTAFGSSLGNPQRILDARLLRLGLQVHF